MKTTVPVLLIALAVVACGGAGSPTTRPSPGTTAPGGTAPAASAPGASTSASSADPTSPEALCLLKAEDWQQFNYVTGASPDVTSDGPGSAICQYASGLFLEVYTDETAADAEETFDTILDNAPYDEPQTLQLPGADEVVFDPSISDDNAGMAVRAGRLTYTISVPSGDQAQAQLTALATLVLTRAGDFR